MRKGKKKKRSSVIQEHWSKYMQSTLSEGEKKKETQKS
jgi:hypothetical protein